MINDQRVIFVEKTGHAVTARGVSGPNAGTPGRVAEPALEPLPQYS
jgi:hypothetical protein